MAGERAPTLNVERCFTLEIRLPPTWPGFSKERNTSSSFGGEHLSAGSRRVCSCPPSGCLTALSPPARVAVRGYQSCMQGLVGLILGWDHKAIVEVRVSWAKSSVGVWLSLERKSSVRAQLPLALILSRWGHTAHFDRLAQHHLLGSGCWVFLLFFIFLESWSMSFREAVFLPLTCNGAGVNGPHAVGPWSHCHVHWESKTNPKSSPSSWLKSPGLLCSQ